MLKNDKSLMIRLFRSEYLNEKIQNFEKVENVLRYFLVEDVFFVISV